MLNKDVKELSEYLLKGGILLYETVSDNHDCKAMIILSADTSDGHYDVKIEFEPKEGESDGL